VPVLRSVVDEKQDARRRQALHQAVERGLRLGIDPVEILENHQKRPDLALPDEEPPYRFQRAEPPVGRVQDLPAPVRHRDVEEREERRQLGLESVVEGEELAGDLLPDRARFVRSPIWRYPLSRSTTGR
jgi:hypothetical protein